MFTVICCSCSPLLPHPARQRHTPSPSLRLTLVGSHLRLLRQSCGGQWPLHSPPFISRPQPDLQAGAGPGYQRPEVCVLDLASGLGSTILLPREAGGGGVGVGGGFGNATGAPRLVSISALPIPSSISPHHHRRPTTAPPNTLGAGGGRCGRPRSLEKGRGQA